MLVTATTIADVRINKSSCNFHSTPIFITTTTFTKNEIDVLGCIILHMKSDDSFLLQLKLEEMIAGHHYDYSCGRHIIGDYRHKFLNPNQEYNRCYSNFDCCSLSLGRMDIFLDSFFENDLKDGIITESEAQEIINLII
ncbi:hypothetical protein H8356DRAFT_1363465 [Neocallimastix lanati (nom. inval.)]|nr:hypothetical protein H8356DRAFT_1363465 [Neocallimastix sp. JGI-2020a]